ncbi:Sodium:neurotransmitter symporter [Trinorchestia longiramus]|nr:Sodium:neurotransmitter symporter [Trinorchestia longiramus]
MLLQMGGLECVITGLLDEVRETFGRRVIRREVFTAIVVTSSFLVSIGNFCQGGMYMFHWLDTYAAGISLLSSALFESIGVAWFYGLDRFTSDIRHMLGFQPSMYWIICWKFISPLFILITILMGIWSMATHALEYHGLVLYVYPGWAEAIGWTITCSSMLMIPLWMTISVCKQPHHTIKEVNQTLSQIFPIGIDAASVDAAGIDAARIDAARIDAARIDAARIDAAGTDAAGTDAAGTDAAGTDAAGIDAAGIDAAASVGTIIRKWKCRNTTVSKPRYGRPWKINDHAARKLVRTVVQRPQTTRKKLKDDLKGSGIESSKHTISRAPRRKRLRSRTPRRTALLLKRHVKARLKNSELRLNRWRRKYGQPLLLNSRLRLSLCPPPSRLRLSPSALLTSSVSVCLSPPPPPSYLNLCPVSASVHLCLVFASLRLRLHPVFSASVSIPPPSPSHLRLHPASVSVCLRSVEPR